MVALFPSRTVALELFGFAVHWYGIMYLLAFLLAWLLLPRLQQYRALSLSRDTWSSVLSSAILGVIVGGRLGFIVFYEPLHYLTHPADIVAVWQGGMSFHGGFLGAVVALLFALRHRRHDMLRFADVVVVPAAIGLALGRMGNFINGELYGPLTTLPWGIAFPGVEGLRHPTQLYAVCKDLLIALCCYAHLRLAAQAAPGRTFALFMVLYGMLRFAIEPLRVQDVAPLHVAGLTLTRGQQLTLPVLLAGLALWVLAPRLHAGTTGGAAGTGRA